MAIASNKPVKIVLRFIFCPNPNFAQFQPLFHSKNRAIKRPKKYPKFLSAIDNIGATIITTITMKGFERKLFNLFIISVFLMTHNVSGVCDGGEF